MNAPPKGAMVAKTKNIRASATDTSEIFQPFCSVNERRITDGVLSAAEEKTVVINARIAITHP